MQRHINIKGKKHAYAVYDSGQDKGMGKAIKTVKLVTLTTSHLERL